MQSSRIGRVPRFTPRWAMAAMLVLAVLTSLGCPGVPSDGNGNQNNGSDTGSLNAVSGEIVTLRSNQVVSALETSLAIFYDISNVPTGASISAFFATVSDPGGSIPDETTINIFQVNLPAGGGQAFVFDPSDAGTGFHKLGLLVQLADESKRIVSNGAVVVEGGPNPRFIRPTSSSTSIVKGQTLSISFDAGDPENQVAWRLFLLPAGGPTDGPADQIGEALATGVGNIGEFTLTTALRTLGTYQLGLSATDSGLSVSGTVADGKNDQIATITSREVVIVAEPEIGAPTLAFSAPGQSDVNLFGSQAFTIRFAASIDPAGGTAEIEIFVDDDCNPSNGVIPINSAPLPITATTIALPTDLDEGTYCVGGRLRQGSNVLEVTAAGNIIIARTPTLTVHAPDTPFPIGPTDTIEVRWSTNVPAGFGLVDVFARTVDANGAATGSEIPVTPEAQETSVTSWDFQRSQSGVYQISVRLALSDASISSADCPNGQCVKTSPRTVRVSTVPAIAWVGELA